MTIDELIPKAAGGEELVDRTRAALPAAVVVEHDAAPRRDPIVERLQAQPDRLIPVGVDVQECHGDGLERWQRVLEPSLDHVDPAVGDAKPTADRPDVGGGSLAPALAVARTRLLPVLLARRRQPLERIEQEHLPRRRRGGRQQRRGSATEHPALGHDAVNSRGFDAASQAVEGIQFGAGHDRVGADGRQQADPSNRVPDTRPRRQVKIVGPHESPSP